MNSMEASSCYGLCSSSKSGIRSLRSGKPVGTIGNHGYWQVGTRRFGIQLAHRVKWMLMHGDIPDGFEIDHINRVRTDNSDDNLRLVSSHENSVNTAVHSDSCTGIKNISPHRGGFMVEVMRLGRRFRKTAATLAQALLIKEEILRSLNEQAVN